MGIRDIVSFDGQSLKELETGFREAVDHYVATSAQVGHEPQKPA
jgi:predicted HicB family RNase H-like nuclease